MTFFIVNSDSYLLNYNSFYKMMFSQLGNLPKALQAEVSETLIQTQVLLALKLLT